MEDPKRIIEKSAKYLRNPDVAKFQELQESNSHLEDIKQANLELIDAVKNIPQVEIPPTPAFPDKIKMEFDGSPATRAAQFFSLLQGEKGDPFTYEDFTYEQLESLKVKGDPGYTPVKGVDYFDGENGKDADEARIIQEVLAKIKIPKPKDGVSPKVEDIVSETVKYIKTLKGDNRLSLRNFKEGDEVIGNVRLHQNMMKNMPSSLIAGDQRWHGGSSGGGGFTLLTTTSAVNDSNQSFVFSDATAQPTLVVSDGIQFTAKDNNSNDQWTWTSATKTVTLVTISPPTTSIFAIA